MELSVFGRNFYLSPNFYSLLLIIICLRWTKAFNETELSSVAHSVSTESSLSSTVNYASSEPEIIDNVVLHLNESYAESRGTEEEEIDNSGEVAGIVIGVLSAFTVLVAAVGYIMYKHFLRKNITSMNFDNPVYRKTTEDQFSLEKNQYLPARSYPPSLEPLTSPGTNEFV